MIKKETAVKIWQCYREIEAGEKLLKDMEELLKQYPGDPYAQHLKDAFGRGHDLQLGIPCGESGHKLFNVSPELAKSIIIVHIANNKALLEELNQAAGLEVRG